MRNFYIAFLCLIFSLVFSAPSQAAVYKLEIRQINPDGVIHSTLCNDEVRICDLEIPIAPEDVQYTGNGQNLKISVLFKNDGAYFKFKWGEEYLFCESRDYFYLRWYKEQKTEKIKLYIPTDVAKTDPDASIVLRPPLSRIAELEITIQPNPKTQILKAPQSDNADSQGGL